MECFDLVSRQTNEQITLPTHPTLPQWVSLIKLSKWASFFLRTHFIDISKSIELSHCRGQGAISLFLSEFVLLVSRGGHSAGDGPQVISICRAADLWS